MAFYHLLFVIICFSWRVKHFIYPLVCIPKDSRVYRVQKFLSRMLQYWGWRGRTDVRSVLPDEVAEVLFLFYPNTVCPIGMIDVLLWCIALRLFPLFLCIFSKATGSTSPGNSDASSSP